MSHRLCDLHGRLQHTLGPPTPPCFVVVRSCRGRDSRFHGAELGDERISVGHCWERYFGELHWGTCTLHFFFVQQSIDLDGMAKIVWSLALQRIFFNVKVTKLSLLGSTIVITSAIFVTVGDFTSRSLQSVLAHKALSSSSRSPLPHRMIPLRNPPSNTAPKKHTS